MAQVRRSARAGAISIHPWRSSLPLSCSCFASCACARAPLPLYTLRPQHWNATCPYLGRRVHVCHGTRVENTFAPFGWQTVLVERWSPQSAHQRLADRPTLDGKARVPNLVCSAIPALPTCSTRQFFPLPSFRAAAPRLPWPDLHDSRAVVLRVGRCRSDARATCTEVACADAPSSRGPTIAVE
jgi:hypothetical protein